MLPNRIACGASKSTSTASPRPRYLPHSFQTACASASPLRAASATDRASTRGIQSNPLQNAGAHPCWISSSALLCANCAIPPPLQPPSKDPAFPYPTGPCLASRICPISPAKPFAPSYSFPFRISPAPIPVPKVRKTTLSKFFPFPHFHSASTQALALF